MKLRALVLVLCMAAGVTAATELQGVYVLPTERCGDYFMVQMTVNGDPGRTLSMLLDTGASHTVIDVDAAERVAGKPIAIGRYARFGQLVAGDLSFSGVRARVLRMDHLQLAIGAPMDGILGFPTFKELLLTIDYPAGEVRVRPGSLPSPDGERILRTIKEKRRPVIALDFGGYRRPVLIDSGAWGGFVLRDSDALGFIEEPVVYDSSLRIDRVMIKSGARLSGDVRLATATLVQPTIQVAESTELVGTEVLSNFSMTFDQKRRRVLFEQKKDEPVEFPAMRDLGWSISPKNEGYRVLRVFDGLGADRAGILPGDLVVAIDGTPVYERDLCERKQEQRPEVPVSVEREGERMEFTVPVDIVVP
jgi:predicted aspartyl protease